MSNGSESKASFEVGLAGESWFESELLEKKLAKVGVKVGFDAAAATENEAVGQLVVADFSVLPGDDDDDLPFCISAILLLLLLKSEIIAGPSNVPKLANNVASVFLSIFRSLKFDEIALFDFDAFDLNVLEFEQETEASGFSGKVIKFAVVAVFPLSSFESIFPKFAGLGPIVVSTKLAVVNLLRTFFTPVLQGVVVNVFLTAGEFASAVELSGLEFRDDRECPLSLL